MRIVSIIILLLAIGCAQKPSFDEASLRGPITVRLECEGDFAEGYSWLFDVKADGTASLKINNFSSPDSREFAVTEDQMNDLRKLLIEQKFFELKAEYGGRVPSGSMRTLRVTCGEHSQTVKLHFLMNMLDGEKTGLREPARALRIWKLVRTWFNDADAVDLQEYDDRVIYASRS